MSSPERHITPPDATELAAIVIDRLDRMERAMEERLREIIAEERDPYLAPASWFAERYSISEQTVVRRCKELEIYPRDMHGNRKRTTGGTTLYSTQEWRDMQELPRKTIKTRFKRRGKV